MRQTLGDKLRRCDLSKPPLHNPTTADAAKAL